MSSLVTTLFSRLACASAVGVGTYVLGREVAQGMREDYEKRQLERQGLVVDKVGDVSPLPNADDYNVIYSRDKDALVYEKTGQVVDTNGEAYKYVITQSKKFRMAPYINGLKHPELSETVTLSNGKKINVAKGAGMSLCDSGACTLNNGSGHFVPRVIDIENAVKDLPLETQEKLTVDPCPAPNPGAMLTRGMLAAENGEDPTDAMLAHSVRQIFRY